MNISGISGGNIQAGQAGMLKMSDPESRNIQKQIADAQKQLQELSENEDMNIEEKMKKRQEIQKQISELNNQLRQHQLEQRKEQTGKKDSFEDLTGGTNRTGQKGNGSRKSALTQAGMKAIISGDLAAEQAKVQGSVATKMEGRAGVLKAEIKQDTAMGDNTKKKEEELAEAEQIAAQASASQMNTLKEANKDMEEAAEAKNGKKEAEEGIEKTAEGVKNAEEGSASGAKTGNVTAESTPKRQETAAENSTAGGQLQAGYTKVDIRL